MMKYAILSGVSALVLSTGALAQVATPAPAASTYVEASFGASHADIDCEGATSCDNSGTAMKLVGGYSFGNGFALELGYIDFGKATASVTGISLKAEAAGVTFGGAYQAQLSDVWGLDFRVGVANIKAKLSGSVSGVGSASDSESNTAPYYGVGLNYAATPRVKVVLAADFSRAEYIGEKTDLRAVSVGVRYAF